MCVCPLCQLGALLVEHHFSIILIFFLCVYLDLDLATTYHTRPRYRVLVLVTQVTIFHLRELVSTWPCASCPGILEIGFSLYYSSIKKFLDTTITTIPNSTYQYTVALKC